LRGLATLNAFGVYSLTYTNSGLEIGSNSLAHGAVTQDGTNFYVTGVASNSAGVKFLNTTDSTYAHGSGIPSATEPAESPLSAPTAAIPSRLSTAAGSQHFSSASNLVYAEPARPT